MVKRIKFLVEKRLTSMMVLFDFLSRRIAPLRQHARVAWLYTGEDDASRLERDRGTDLDLKVPPSPPPAILHANFLGPDDEVEAAEGSSLCI
jgi:hypothetical protein